MLSLSQPDFHPSRSWLLEFAACPSGVGIHERREACFSRFLAGNTTKSARASTCGGFYPKKQRPESLAAPRPQISIRFPNYSEKPSPLDKSSLAVNCLPSATSASSTDAFGSGAENPNESATAARFVYTTEKPLRGLDSVGVGVGVPTGTGLGVSRGRGDGQSQATKRERYSAGTTSPIKPISTTR